MGWKSYIRKMMLHSVPLVLLEQIYASASIGRGGIPGAPHSIDRLSRSLLTDDAFERLMVDARDGTAELALAAAARGLETGSVRGAAMFDRLVKRWRKNQASLRPACVRMAGQGSLRALQRLHDEWDVIDQFIIYEAVPAAACGGAGAASTLAWLLAPNRVPQLSTEERRVVFDGAVSSAAFAGHAAVLDTIEAVWGSGGPHAVRARLGLVLNWPWCQLPPSIVRWMAARYAADPFVGTGWTRAVALTLDAHEVVALVEPARRGLAAVHAAAADRHDVARAFVEAISGVPGVLVELIDRDDASASIVDDAVDALLRLPSATQAQLGAALVSLLRRGRAATAGRVLDATTASSTGAARSDEAVIAAAFGGCAEALEALLLLPRRTSTPLMPLMPIAMAAAIYGRQLQRTRMQVYIQHTAAVAHAHAHAHAEGRIAAYGRSWDALVAHGGGGNNMGVVEDVAKHVADLSIEGWTAVAKALGEA